MSEESFAQKRQYYRLKYPKRARPLMRVDDELFHVSEVSEKGVRLLIRNLASFYRGLSMVGTLNLHDHSTVKVSGAVLRFDGDEVILQLSKGPSFKDMVSEQRHIRQKYPSFFASQKAVA
ncbi:PilZ domain-containing protein [Vibrio sp. T187]|uniref:PilZ domain-containing protein n=1 Tax=Vibrio TaxID=662 RepID=UPI0010C95911|nr:MULTISPECIES: PilZ domain-containing protein [Vibrio]MBW3694723.1 PilZ domain-containing protein [Vibrio sp. T187]